MTFAMNPQQVKHREYLGLSAIAVGLLTALPGLVCLLFAKPIGLALLGLGAALSVAGLCILVAIPDIDVVGPVDDIVAG